MIFEYLTLAVTHIARGKAAAEARFAFCGSKESRLDESSCSTDSRLSAFMDLASKYLEKV